MYGIRSNGHKLGKYGFSNSCEMKKRLTQSSTEVSQHATDGAGRRFVLWSVVLLLLMLLLVLLEVEWIQFVAQLIEVVTLELHHETLALRTSFLNKFHYKTRYLSLATTHVTISSPLYFILSGIKYVNKKWW